MIFMSAVFMLAYRYDDRPVIQVTPIGPMELYIPAADEYEEYEDIDDEDVADEDINVEDEGADY